MRCNPSARQLPDKQTEIAVIPKRLVMWDFENVDLNIVLNVDFLTFIFAPCFLFKILIEQNILLDI